jgi:tetratricopeptide (TPR) repeat protein
MKRLLVFSIWCIVYGCASSSFVSEKRWQDYHTAEIKILNSDFPTPSFTNKKGKTIVPTKTEINSDSKTYKFHIEKLYKKNLNINVNSEMFENFSLEINRKTRPGVLTLDVISSVFVIGYPFLIGHFANSKMYKLENAEYSFSPKISNEFYEKVFEKIKNNSESKKTDFDNYISNYPNSNLINEAKEAALNSYFKEKFPDQESYVDLKKFTSDLKIKQDYYGLVLKDNYWSKVNSLMSEKLNLLREQMVVAIQKEPNMNTFWNVIENFNNKTYESNIQSNNDLFSILTREIKELKFSNELIVWNPELKSNSTANEFLYSKIEFRDGVKNGFIKNYGQLNNIISLEFWSKNSHRTTFYLTKSGSLKNEKKADIYHNKKDFISSLAWYKEALNEIERLEEFLIESELETNIKNRIISKDKITEKVKNVTNEYVQHNIKKGNNFLSQKEYDKALGFFKTALDYSPDNGLITNKIEICEKKISEENKKREQEESKRRAEELLQTFSRINKCFWCAREYKGWGYGDAIEGFNDAVCKPGFPSSAGDFCSGKCSVEYCWSKH